MVYGLLPISRIKMYSKGDDITTEWLLLGLFPGNKGSSNLLDTRSNKENFTSFQSYLSELELWIFIGLRIDRGFDLFMGVWVKYILLQIKILNVKYLFTN